MKEKEVMRVFDNNRGWHHVVVLSKGRKWARVQFFGPGVVRKGKRVPKVKQVRVEELQARLW